jgi:hypothetical protein
MYMLSLSDGSSPVDMARLDQGFALAHRQMSLYQEVDGMKTIRIAMVMASVCVTLALVGCDQKPAEAEQAAAVAPKHVSENDLYLQRMQQDVKIDDPDSLIEDVNETVGQDDNAEKSKQLAAQGVGSPNNAPPAER